MQATKQNLITTLILLLALSFTPANSSLGAAALSTKESAMTLRNLDPAIETLPDCSLQDFRSLLSAPAGKLGFVESRGDGHFYFASGARARFWGVNISSYSLRQSHEKIDEVVEILARAGVNIVRLEAVDNRGCLLDDKSPDSRHFDPEYLDRLDYWMFALRKHGIYYYINLLDFRTFKEADGVANADKLDRAAKPYALFSRKLIDLQKEFAEEFLVKHVNPYTKLPLVKDPAMALVELFNEDGILSRGDKWPTLAEPYGAELRASWNKWLKDRYGSTEKLSAAWTNAKGEKALSATESLEAGNVGLPSMELGGLDGVLHGIYTDPLRSPARRNDACAFGYEQIRSFCKEMKEFLVSKGLRVPTSAVVAGHYPPETAAVADELDFTSENYYFDHPNFEAGKEWTSAAYYSNNNQLLLDSENTFAPWCTAYHWKKKPVAVREFATVWPNQFRAASVPETAAMASLQGIDCVLLFGYSLRIPIVGDFACQADPTRWGQMGIAAKTFLEGELKEETSSVEIVYADRDLFNYYGYLTSLYSLAWSAKLENAGAGEADKEGKVLRVLSGRGGLPADPGNFSIIFSQYPYGDLAQRTSIYADGIYAGYKITLAEAPDSRFTFNGLMYDLGTFDAHTTHGFSSTDVVAKGYRPIGISGDNQVCLGFFDPTRENYVFRDIQMADVRRIALDALAARIPGFTGHHQVETGLLSSPSGQVKRDTKNGILYIKSDRYEAMVGALPKVAPEGALLVSTETPFGSITAVSLDGKPLAVSDHYLVKMVSIAHNTGEKLTITRNNGGSRLTVDSPGAAPVVTDGKPSDTPTVISIAGKRILEVGMTNGTWELLRDGPRMQLYCDTPGIAFVIPGEYTPAGGLTATAPDNTVTPIPLERRFRYPAGAKYVSVGMAE